MERDDNVKRSHPLTVLALGMLCDISAPLLLVEDCDLIIAIDNIDPNYHLGYYKPCGKPKDFSEVRRIIKHILEEGSDLELLCDNCLMRLTSTKYPMVVRSLRGKCKIVEETLDQKDKRWVVDFIYGIKVRRLVYYYERDYVKEDWPSDCCRVEYLLTIGSPFPAYSKRDELTFRLMRACEESCVVFASKVVFEDEPEGWNLKKFPEVAWNRGSETINCYKFYLKDWFESNIPKPVSFCIVCRKIGNKKCGKCKAVTYCSTECQKKHWPLHKSKCE